MKNIAVIGLGIMGHGVADNFLEHNYKVFIWNRDDSKAKDLVAKGAVLCDSPKQAAKQADIVFEVTASDESSRAVWLGEDGILAGSHEGLVAIACPTLTVDWVLELGKECEAKQVTLFDMPMTGSRKGAEGGQLLLLAGGDEEKLNDIKDELEQTIAKQVRYFGPVGAGTKYKLILNTVQGIHLLALGEALQMAKEAGLDVKTVGDALSEVPGGTATNFVWKCYQEKPSPINFSVAWEAKDLTYAQQMAKDGSYPIRDTAQEKFKKAVDSGHGDEDWTTLTRL